MPKKFCEIDTWNSLNIPEDIWGAMAFIIPIGERPGFKYFFLLLETWNQLNRIKIVSLSMLDNFDIDFFIFGCGQVWNSKILGSVQARPKFISKLLKPRKAKQKINKMPQKWTKSKVLCHQILLGLVKFC